MPVSDTAICKDKIQVMNTSLREAQQVFKYAHTRIVYMLVGAQHFPGS
jgi:hypothetical protein